MHTAEWQKLSSSAIVRKHSGDIEGAILEMEKALTLTRTMPLLLETTVTNLNYLADLYLIKAETLTREAIELSRSLNPLVLADNLWVLARVQIQNCQYREAKASAGEALRLFREQDHAYGVSQMVELIGRIRSISPEE